jgi:uncharacterized membrane protein
MMMRAALGVVLIVLAASQFGCVATLEDAQAAKGSTGALALMTAVYGDNSPQVKALLDRRDEIAALKVMQQMKDGGSFNR